MPTRTMLDYLLASMENAVKDIHPVPFHFLNEGSGLFQSFWRCFYFILLVCCWPFQKHTKQLIRLVVVFNNCHHTKV